MWAELKHPRHVEFYREFHESRDEFEEDWMPMVRAVEYLRSQDYAAELFAFTSLAHFRITTAPSYAEQAGHSCVGVTWSSRDRLFGLGFWELESVNGESEISITKCSEEEFPSLVGAFIIRLGVT